MFRVCAAIKCVFLFILETREKLAKLRVYKIPKIHVKNFLLESFSVWDMTNKINKAPNRSLKPKVTVDYLHQSTAHNPRESIQVAEIFKFRTDRQVG